MEVSINHLMCCLFCVKHLQYLYWILHQMRQKWFLLALLVLQPAKSRTGRMWKPAGVRVEFSRVAQTKPQLCYRNSRKASGCSSAVFPLALIHLDSRWRSLAWLETCDRCQRELWMGRQAEAHTHTHTHTHRISSGSTALMQLSSEQLGSGYI